MECNQNSPEPPHPLLDSHSPQSTINISLASNHTQIVREEVESEQEGFEQKLFQTEIMHFSSYISSSVHHLKKLHLGNAQCIYPKSHLYNLPPSAPIPSILPLSSSSSITQQIPYWLLYAPKGSSVIKQSSNNSLLSFINNTKLTCIYNRHGENLLNKHDPTIFIANVKSILQTDMHRNFNTLLKENSSNNSFSKDKGDSQGFSLGFVSSFEGGNLHSAWKDIRTNRGDQLNKIHQDSHSANSKNSQSNNLSAGKSHIKVNKSHSRGKSKGIQKIKQTSNNLQTIATGVQQNRGSTYYLLLQNDINTHGYNQWFNFVVLGTCQCSTQFPHSHTATFIIFNISKEVKYHPNMQILTHNYTESKWQYNTPYQYYKNKFIRYNGMNYKTIQFTYAFKMKNNLSQIQFCLTYPYSYTRMTALCRQMLHTVPGGAYRIKVRTIGKSEGGNYLQVVSFIQGEENKEKEGKRSCVVIIARQHPAETVSSFVCQHFIRLLSETQTPAPFDYHIIPMCNPDGTIHGNSRTNLKGYDINRSWPQPKQHLCPQSIETDHILKYIKSLPVSPTSIIDLHGHSRDFDAFGYFGDDGLWGRLLNYGIDKECKFYKYQKSSYGINYKKRPTLRGHMYYNLGIKQVATIEMSMFGHFSSQFSSKQKDFIPFGDDHFKQLATAIHSSLIEAHFVMSPNKMKDSQHISKIMESVCQKQKSRAKYIQQIGYYGNDSDSDPEDEYLRDQERNKIGIQAIHSNKVDSQQAGPIFTSVMAKSIQIRETGNDQQNQNFKNQSGHGGMIFSMHSVSSVKSVQDLNNNNVRNNSNINRSKIPPKKVSHQKSISLKSKRKPIYTSTNVQLMPYERLFQLERSQKRMSVDNNEYLTRKTLIESKIKQKQVQIKSTNVFKANNKIMVSQPLLQYPTVRNVRLDIDKVKHMCSSVKILQDTLYGDKSSQEKCNTGGGFNFGQRTKYDNFHTAENKQGKFVGNRRRVHTEDHRKEESEEKDGLFILGMRGNRRKKVVALDFVRK